MAGEDDDGPEQISPVWGGRDARRKPQPNARHDDPSDLSSPGGAKPDWSPPAVLSNQDIARRRRAHARALYTVANLMIALAWAVLASGVVVGLILAFHSRSVRAACAYCQASTEYPYVAGGIGLAVGSAVSALWTMLAGTWARAYASAQLAIEESSADEDEDVPDDTNGQ